MPNDYTDLDAFLQRIRRYCVAVVTDLLAAAYQSLFKRMLNTEKYILQPLLLDKNYISNNLHSRQRDRQSVRKSVLQ